MTQKELYKAIEQKAQHAINYYNKFANWSTWEELKQQNSFFRKLCQEGEQLGEQYNLTLTD